MTDIINIGLSHLLRFRGFLLFPIVFTASLSGGCSSTPLAARAVFPKSASVVVVPPPYDAGLGPMGNIKVVFSDGHSEMLTDTGNCMFPLISRSGDVGWICTDVSRLDRVRKMQRGRDQIMLRSAVGKTKIFVVNPGAPHIEEWAFVEDGRSLVIRSSGQHGPRFYTMYEIASGQILNTCDGFLPLDEVPEWAQPVALWR